MTKKSEHEAVEESTGVAGKAIVVTGAGGGLGSAYARALADAGARVVVNDVAAQNAHDVVEQIRAAGGEAVASVGSVSDENAARALVQTCLDSFGRLDGLVNNAAIFHDVDWRDETENELRRIVEINVLGVMFTALHAFREMSARGGGTILNVTSGSHIGREGMVAYGSTKGAVASFTYNLALEGRPHGITVIGLSPLAAGNMSILSRVSDVTQKATATPESVAPAVVYLMSDRARNLAGQVIRFNGSALCLLDPPHFRTPRVVREQWTAADVADAFETTLDDAIHPVGAVAAYPQTWG